MKALVKALYVWMGFIESFTLLIIFLKHIFSNDD